MRIVSVRAAEYVSVKGGFLFVQAYIQRLALEYGLPGTIPSLYLHVFIEAETELEGQSIRVSVRMLDPSDQGLARSSRLSPPLLPGNDKDPLQLDVAVNMTELPVASYGDYHFVASLPHYPEVEPVTCTLHIYDAEALTP